MPQQFNSRAQMGWLYRNKRDVYDKKVMVPGDITQLPWRVSSKNLTREGRLAVREAHAQYKAGKISRKQFEKVFRDQFPQAKYVPTGKRRGRPRKVSVPGALKVGRSRNGTTRYFVGRTRK